MPAFAKQVGGLETAQGRKEDAVKRHFRVSCVAQSRLQPAPASGAATARCMFAQGAATIGQKVRTIAREALQRLLKLGEPVLAQGHSGEHLLEVLMPVSYVATSTANLPSRVTEQMVALSSGRLSCPSVARAL